MLPSWAFSVGRDCVTNFELNENINVSPGFQRRPILLNSRLGLISVESPTKQLTTVTLAAFNSLTTRYILSGSVVCSYESSPSDKMNNNFW